jgi:predicted transposase YdaD
LARLLNLESLSLPFFNRTNRLPQLKRIYLEDYQDRQGFSLTLEFIRLIGSSEAQAVDLARKLVERQDEIGPEIIDFIETILVYKLPILSRQEIIAMLTLDNLELKQTRFYQEIAEEENGKGRQQESQRLVGRMMRHKFGGTPAVQQAEEKLPALSVEQLEELAEALLDLTDTQALTHWLAARLGHLI